MSFRFLNTLLLSCMLLVPGVFMHAQQNDTLHSGHSGEKWSYHFQFTNVDQGHPKFSAPYAGKNSLDSNSETAASVTASLYLGHKLWKGASVFINPEIAGGKGMSSTLGIAGFPNGETFRIGDPSPTLYLARGFIRQQISLNRNCANDTLGCTCTQLNGECVASRRLTITAGKISLADIFDNNSISHDPRKQFMNWALMNNAAWDYPANTRGYTEGVIVEYYSPQLILRFAETLMSKEANGEEMDLNVSRSRGETFEAEKSWKLFKRKGTARLLLFHNLSRAGSYRTAIDNLINGTDPSMNVNTLTAYNGLKYGFGINTEQQLTDNISAFCRYSWNDGHTASWEFTEIDRSFSAGLQILGKKWRRPHDVFGMAILINGLSQDHWDFLNYGGYGFMLGDGKLPHYGSEQIFETYYSIQLASSLWLSGDYQYVMNPGYNRERGPVHVGAVRVHVEF
ncbi:MAG TPA: carbohydrate porin [Bacteroidia bacterium]|jgi:high affinity Mn2+ porin|nr:carbohydrate porin [Bacteroidia bacterium]